MKLPATVHLLCCLISFSNIVFAENYYVAKTGKDTNTGTEDQPWLTVSYAAGTLSPGDTLYIKNGIYTERVEPVHSGTKDNPITYRNYPGDEVTIDADGENSCIHVSDKEYLTFIGLHLTGANGEFYSRSGGMSVSGSSGNIIMDSLTCTGNSAPGISLVGHNGIVQQCLIRNCSVGRNTGDGAGHNLVIYRRVNNVRVENNHFFYAGNAEVWAHNLKIISWDDAFNSDGSGPEYIYIINNVIEYAGVQGIQTWNAHYVLIKGNYFHHNGATGCQIESGTKYCIVTDNIFEYNSTRTEYGWETGVWVDRTDHCVVRNNISRRNNQGIFIGGACHQIITRNNLSYLNDGSGGTSDQTLGIRVHGDWPKRDLLTDDVMVVHNTLYRNGKSGTDLPGMILDVYADNCVAKNNIVSGSASGIEISATAAYTLSNNCYFGGTTAIEGDSRNAVNTDPLFTDPDEADFSLREQSPLIDSGCFLTVTTGTGTGNGIPVEDARCFCDGYGITEGDRVQIGTNTPVIITDVDYQTDVLTVDGTISWSTGDGVSFPYNGNKPDIGAVETGSDAPTIHRLEKNRLHDEDVLSCKSFPNKPTIEISFSIEKTGHVVIDLLNMRGRFLHTVFEGVRSKGLHTVVYNPSHVADPIPCGIFLVRMTTVDYQQYASLYLLR